MKKILIVLMFVMFAGMNVFAGGVSETSQQEGAAEQESIMQKARALFPTPDVDNFLTRKAVVKWVERMDKPGKIFYIYIMSDVGTITHYFVAEYRPVSTATFLTPTRRIETHSYGNLALPSNALDGTYYGEGGAANQYFFFDAETGAYIELKGLNYIVSDQPFETEAPAISFKKQE